MAANWESIFDVLTIMTTLYRIQQHHSYRFRQELKLPIELRSNFFKYWIREYTHMLDSQCTIYASHIPVTIDHLFSCKNTSHITRCETN